LTNAQGDAVLSEYKRKTNIGVGVGILLQIASKVVDKEGLEILSLALAVAGFVLFIWGCASYARGKGLSPWFGALGVLSIIGLIVLVSLPDRHKERRDVA
jgi:TRAP-type C4-dicarboxylate transport system permease small subunit